MSLSLERHSAPTGVAPSPERPAPLVQFRTLNGYVFWPLPPEAEAAGHHRVRRLFEVLAPDGERRRCAVEVAAGVRGLAAQIAGVQLPPEHPAWDGLCRSGLSYHLWSTAAFPPEPLTVHSLNREQMRMVSAVAKGAASILDTILTPATPPPGLNS
jgi:hypothetical protein